VSVHDDSKLAATVVVVAVDVGKNTVALSVSEVERHRLLGPVDFPMTKSGLSCTLARVGEVLPQDAVVKVGIEAAGHYHRPLLAPSAWPSGWEVFELNPAHVGEQRGGGGPAAGEDRRDRPGGDLPTSAQARPAPHRGVPVARERRRPGHRPGLARTRVHRHHQHLPAPPRLLRRPSRTRASQRAGSVGGCERRRARNDNAGLLLVLPCFRSSAGGVRVGAACRNQTDDLLITRDHEMLTQASRTPEMQRMQGVKSPRLHSGVRQG
jgi:hypothetical protein